jgi:hypothetical protein
MHPAAARSKRRAETGRKCSSAVKLTPAASAGADARRRARASARGLLESDPYLIAPCRRAHHDTCERARNICGCGGRIDQNRQQSFAATLDRGGCDFNGQIDRAQAAGGDARRRRTRRGPAARFGRRTASRARAVGPHAHAARARRVGNRRLRSQDSGTGGGDRSGRRGPRARIARHRLPCAAAWSRQRLPADHARFPAAGPGQIDLGEPAGAAGQSRTAHAPRRCVRGGR